MANRSPNRGHRPKKLNARRVNVNLQNLEIASDMPLNTTETIELALKMLSIVKDAAIEGKPEAVSLLARMGLEVTIETIEPTIVLRSDSAVAA